MIGPDIERHLAGDQIVLWHRGTGRHVRLAAASLAALEQTPDDPRLAPLRHRLASEYLLAAAPAPRCALIALRSRLVITLPDRPALWVPVPDHRTAGGHGYQALPLTEEELRIWLAINDSRAVHQVARAADSSEPRVLALLDRLCSVDVQAVQLRVTPPRRGDLALQRLFRPPRPDNARTTDQRGEAGQTTLTAWHLAIRDGEHHFDDVETTVAHALGLPHAALGDEPFGARLRRVLDARGVATDGMVVEVGCGDGELAAAWLAAGPPPRRYLRVDLSPALLATQARRASGSHGLLGDATALPLRDGSVDTLLCNEVIADLSAVPWSRSEEGDAVTAEVAARVAHYGLDPLPGRALYNLGAWKFVEEVARVLRPGGWAYVSEFGGDDEVPTETAQLDHPEVSIHFGHLAAVARGVGLQVEGVGLAELLHADLHAIQLARHSHEALRALARSHGRHLPARASEPAAWEGDDPPAGERVHGLHWVDQTEPGAGPLITRFRAVLLTRPRTAE